MINGLQCYEVFVNFKIKSGAEKKADVLLKQKRVYYVKDKVAYSIACTDSNSGYSKNQPDFDVIISSFKVK